MVRKCNSTGVAFGLSSQYNLKQTPLCSRLQICQTSWLSYLWIILVSYLTFLFTSLFFSPYSSKQVISVSELSLSLSRGSHRGVFPPLLSGRPQVHQRHWGAQPQQGRARDVSWPAAGMNISLWLYIMIRIICFYSATCFCLAVWSGCFDQPTSLNRKCSINCFILGLAMVKLWPT